MNFSLGVKENYCFCFPSGFPWLSCWREKSFFGGLYLWCSAASRWCPSILAESVTPFGGICVKLCTCYFWQRRSRLSVSSLPSSPAASLFPSYLPLSIIVLTLKAAPITCCLSYLSKGCRGQSSHKTLPETCGKPLWRKRRRHTWLAFSHLPPWAAAAKVDLISVGFQHK